MGDTRGIGVSDVIGEARRVLGVDTGAHVAFGLIGIGILFAGWVAMAVGIAGLGDAIDHAVLGFGAVALLAVGRGIGYALQCAGSTAVACARLRGAPLSYGAALRTLLARAPALGAHVAIRVCLELVPSALLAAAAFAGARAVGDEHLGAQLLVALGVLPLWAAFHLLFRAYFGLAFACVADGSGPVEALWQSLRLLEGRRAAFVGLRVAVIGLYSLASCCLFVGVLGGPAVFLGAVVTHLVIALDAVVDACALERARGRVDADDLARTFA